MAQNDLDAALQLLAERAQYITGASGAAIALRRGEHHDMLCRASAGSNAPELGALLSMDYGLSGESVRTRQVLRCDDVERDSRVNHEVCRQLGIASVVVMPIVSDEQVLGVFELLSGEPRAFGERDLSAFRRLGEMVEVAVKHAVIAQTLPAQATPEEDLAAAEPQVFAPVRRREAVRDDFSENAPRPQAAPAMPENELSGAELERQKLEPQELQPQELQPQKLTPQASTKTELEATTPEPSPKKPLFWSAAMQTRSDGGATDQAVESIPVPAGLRNLRKCQACGFPVSQGRTFCVECEEKQWRSQRLPQPAAGAVQQARKHDSSSAQTKAARNGDLPIPAGAAALTGTPHSLPSAPIPSHASVEQPAIVSSSKIPANRTQTLPQDMPATISGFDSSAPFFSSAVSSQSWFAANKYILGALLVVAIVIGLIVLIR
jgi:hypothetical protein